MRRSPEGVLTMVRRVLDERWLFPDKIAAAGVSEKTSTRRPPTARLNERNNLHLEDEPDDKRAGAEQLGHDEHYKTETAGRRRAVTVMGQDFGFHLVSVQEVAATLGVTRVAWPQDCSSRPPVAPVEAPGVHSVTDRR